MLKLRYKDGTIRWSSVWGGLLIFLVRFLLAGMVRGCIH